MVRLYSICNSLRNPNQISLCVKNALLLIWLFILLFIVPSSPINISLSSVSGFSNLLSASWSVPIPKNGIITGYTVYCNTSASQSYPEQVIGPNIPTIRSIVNGTTLAVTFKSGLNPYTQYSCYVTANTSAGEGSRSVVVTARTVEGGVCIMLELIYLCL